MQTVRGSLLPVRGKDKWAVATLHPAFLLRGADSGERGKAQDHLEPLLSVDARRAMTCAVPRIPKVRMESDASAAHAALLKDCPTMVAVDIEGSNGKPQIVGVSWKVGEAWVMPWGDDVRALLDEVGHHMPVFHNASYDVPELAEAGVTPPKEWVDTINLAARYDPSLPKNLQFQVLTHVPGSCAWKGLVNHKKGYDYDGGAVAMWRALWAEILRRLGRRVPATSFEWYCFYNGLDTAWTFELQDQLQEKLNLQKRLPYYWNLMQPLQAPLLDLGLRGMPADEDRIAFHRVACQRLQRMANRILKDAGREMNQQSYDETQRLVTIHEASRTVEKAAGAKKYSAAADLSKLRGKLRAQKELAEGDFNFDSHPQCVKLLYSWFGLPEVRNRKTKGATTDDKAIESLLKRLTRTDADGKACPTLKPKRGTVDEAARIVRAIGAGRKWRTWESTFLQPELRRGTGRPRIPTQYSQHRTTTGRLSSGTDDTESEKTIKRQQLQNVPKKLRDLVVADEGYTCVGADWAGIEWAISMWYCSKVDPKGPHLAMLDAFWRKELDPHIFLATHAFGVAADQITTRQRQVCKPYTHGYFFGGTAVGLAREVGHPDRVGIQVCRAHDEAFQGQRFREETVRQAIKQKFVETPLGWRRYFWGSKPSPTEILGTKVQATAADLLKYVLAQMFKGYVPSDYEALTNTHDSLLFQAPTHDKPWLVKGASPHPAAAWLKAQMEQPIPWLDGRQWRADVKVGPNWRSVS
jgi:DNA polymerase I-like protein with 3'-5' exonuclease and polymerase domains